MATATNPVSTSDTAILARLIRPDDDSLSAEAAKALLNIRFESGDLDRMHELVVKNQDDALTPAERAEMDNYRGSASCST
jgi:hypothetical protein